MRYLVAALACAGLIGMPVAHADPDDTRYQYHRRGVRGVQPGGAAGRHPGAARGANDGRENLLDRTAPERVAKCIEGDCG